MKFRASRYAIAGLSSFGPLRLASRINPFARLSWAQEGEDLILARFMEPRERGFYVDVGAHDPFRFSSTAYFYLRGWSGLNIEPDPDGARLIQRYRRRDTTVNLGVGSVRSEMAFFRFDEPALNTFSAALADQRQKQGTYKIVQEVKVTVDRLENILSQCLLPSQKIDFMTVDAEGFDLDVLKSNDWDRFRPEIVVAEGFHRDLKALAEDAMTIFMESVEYRLVAKAMNSAFFAARETL